MFSINIKKTLGESRIKFSNLKYKQNIFYEFLTQNKLQIFLILMNFVKILTSEAHKKLFWYFRFMLTFFFKFLEKF